MKEKLLIIGDVHFSTYSSILRKRGEYYSQRLENCIRSIIWAEELALSENCTRIVYLGDIFDKPELTSEEITALQEIGWVDLPHYFLCGNHEMGLANLNYTSTHIFNLCPKCNVINKPLTLYWNNNQILFLPYILNDEERKLSKYLEYKDVPTIIFSHNDIKGFDFGRFVSKEGFAVDDIEANCNYFFNGHLHNNGVINNKIINVGNLTGQNFSEDASKHNHQVYTLELDPFYTKLTSFENPYAYNFYKKEVNTIDDINRLDFKPNCVLSIKCVESLISTLREKLNNDRNISDYRIISIPEIVDKTIENTQRIVVNDHLTQFKNYILENLDNTEILSSELRNILG